MTDKKFRGKSEKKVWFPLIENIITGSNLAIDLSDNNDEKYCYILAMIHDMLVPMYVDNGLIELKDFNRLFYVYVYVLETVYGDPYSKESKTFKRLVSTEECFNQIKKHWNDNITAEMKKYN